MKNCVPFPLINSLYVCHLPACLVPSATSVCSLSTNPSSLALHSALRTPHTTHTPSSVLTSTDHSPLPAHHLPSLSIPPLPVHHHPALFHPPPYALTPSASPPPACTDRKHGKGGGYSHAQLTLQGRVPSLHAACRRRSGAVCGVGATDLRPHT